MFSTVTRQSRKPCSATISAVSNFCVLAAARSWSAFFSYNVCPLCASTTMTEAAPVLGTPPEVRGCTSTSGSGAGRGLRGLGCLVACAFGFGVASPGSTADAFGYGVDAPVGPTPWGSSGWADALTADVIAQNHKDGR